LAALGERGVGNDAQRVEAMVARHGPMLLRVANQFSLCHDDALDAYQRALEIYLRRLDTVEPATEGAWLRVVVKHEAMAIRNARAASVETDEVDLDERESTLREVEDTVAGGERVGRSVEALKSLKPDEAKALLLKAEGLSYDEIGRQFGWSYTKVNRSIAEGRKRFLKVYRGIEAGEACERYEPVLDALAGGTATSAQVLSIRPHLRHCAACRATVRSMRFSRTRRIALLGPFAWISRVLSRPEVVQLTSSGGGRFGPAAGLVGLCLTGAGAGAACVMTGALPAAPLIAHHEAKPAPVKHKAKKKIRIVSTAKPTARSTPEPPPRVYAAKATSTPTSTPKPKAKATRKAKPVVHKKKPVVDEFGIEGATPTTAPAKTAAVATTSNVGGGGSSTPKRSSGGGGSSKASSNEFGIEG
jgi:RNA polymerase sigma factor (sigma-70 family)